MNSKYMTLVPNQIPRGCYREIRKYQFCKQNSSEEACLNDKISIMEVCPDHVLEGLREKKKWTLRAEVIDNDTYKRAMQISDYNKGRSVSDLKLKTWDYGKGNVMRSDSTWQDDRYNPVKYPHPHRYDSVNFPKQEFRDIFGGTLGEAAQKDAKYHTLGLFDGKSQAMLDLEKEQRAKSLKDVVKEVNAHNEKKDKGHH